MHYNVYYKPTDSRYLLHSSSHLSHVKTSVPFSQLFRLRRFWLSCFCQFKRSITEPNKLIGSQHYKRHRRKMLMYSIHSHFTLTTAQLNLSFSETLNYQKRFRDCYYLLATSTNFIQTWQKRRQHFVQKFLLNK